MTYRCGTNFVSRDRVRTS